MVMEVKVIVMVAVTSYVSVITSWRGVCEIENSKTSFIHVIVMLLIIFTTLMNCVYSKVFFYLKLFVFLFRRHYLITIKCF